MKILGKEHKIEYIKPNAFTDSAWLGLYNSKQATISVNEDMSNDEKEETVLHEVLHAIDINLKLKLSEKQVTALSSGLFCVLKENGQKVEFK